MAVLNPIDASTTVSAASAGMVVNLAKHATLRLSLLGVPVRFKVKAEGVAGDTGVIRVVDSSGLVRLSVLVNGGKGWYESHGYLPATRDKYDLQLSGNTLGTLKLYSASVYEYDWTQDGINGALASTLGAVTLDAHIDPNNNLNASIGNISAAATGTVDVQGSATPTIDAVTPSAIGTVATPAPTWQAVGTTAGGGGSLSPSWPTHAVGDVGILVVMTSKFGSDPGAPTLSTANGFTAVTGGSALSNGSTTYRMTLFWARATSTSMAAPAVNIGSYDSYSAYIITFRGCISSGTPTDGVGLTTNTASNTSVSIPGATTSNVNRVVLVAISHASAATCASYVNANLSGLTEQIDTAPSAGPRCVAATGTAASSGAYGSTTATLSSAAVWFGVSLALKAA